MSKILKIFGIFNINTIWKSIFWIIWDITFALYDFINAKTWTVYLFGVAMCVCLVIHIIMYLDLRNKQREKINELVSDFMRWFPENYKNIVESKTNE
jgi:hypothetical protein